MKFLELLKGPNGTNIAKPSLIAVVLRAKDFMGPTMIIAVFRRSPIITIISTIKPKIKIKSFNS